MLQIIHMWQLDSHSGLFRTHHWCLPAEDAAVGEQSVCVSIAFTVGSCDHASAILKYQRLVALTASLWWATAIDYCLIYLLLGIVGKGYL